MVLVLVFHFDYLTAVCLLFSLYSRLVTIIVSETYAILDIVTHAFSNSLCLPPLFLINGLYMFYMSIFAEVCVGFLTRIRLTQRDILSNGLRSALSSRRRTNIVNKTETTLMAIEKKKNISTNIQQTILHQHAT